MNKRLLSIALCLVFILTSVLFSACSEDIVTTTSNNKVSSRPTAFPQDTVLLASSMLIKYTLNDIIIKSRAAVIGKVIDILPSKQENRDGTMIIYTDIVIKPERYLYGKPEAERIVVRVNEGRVGNTVMLNPDEAEFILGETCLVFLIYPYYAHTTPEGFDDANYYVLWGQIAGKLYIDGDTFVDITGAKMTLSEIEMAIASVGKGN